MFFHDFFLFTPGEAPKLTPNELVSPHLHETLTSIENLVEAGHFNGSTEQFFKVVEECAALRPESSVFRLISYLALNISPVKHLWFSNLNDLLHRYYQQDKRANVRREALKVLSDVITLNR